MHRFWHLINPAVRRNMVPADASSVAAYPNKPIHFIVPFAKGGPGDMLARVIGEKLSESFMQPVNVDNQDATNVGLQMAAKAVPDGCTIIMAVDSFYINPCIRKLPFDPVKDFAPVSLLSSIVNMLVVHPSVPANSLKELIAYAKANPTRLNFASSRPGGAPHLMGELLNNLAGIKMGHITYPGHVAAAKALSEGREVQVMFDAMITAMPHVRSGEVKALAVTTPRRASKVPNIPTMVEGGLSGFTVDPASGLLAPTGTPLEIREKLSREIAKLLHMPDVKTRLQNVGMEPIGSSPAELAAYMKTAFATWAKVVGDINFNLKE